MKARFSHLIQINKATAGLYQIILIFILTILTYFLRIEI